MSNFQNIKPLSNWTGGKIAKCKGFTFKIMKNRKNKNGHQKKREIIFTLKKSNGDVLYHEKFKLETFVDNKTNLIDAEKK